MPAYIFDRPVYGAFEITIVANPGKPETIEFCAKFVIPATTPPIAPPIIEPYNACLSLISTPNKDGSEIPISPVTPADSCVPFFVASFSR